VRDLEAPGHRGSATANEELAADYLVQELNQIGVEAQKEFFRSYSSYGARILTHMFVGVLGLALLPWSAASSMLLSAVALVSFQAESITRFRLLSRLLPTSQSCNVVGRIPAASGQAARRVVLCAHIDTQRSGLIWSALFVRPFSYIFARVPGPVRAPLFSLTLALSVQLVLGGLILSGVVLTNLVVIGLAVYYAGALVLVGQWSIGKFVPGGCDNASGVAAALVLASRWRQQPRADVELVVLLPGSEEVGSLGAAAWLDAPQSELTAIPTCFLNLDTLGYGAPHCITTSCSLSGPQFRYPASLLRRCAAIAERLGLSCAVGHSPPTPTDGLAFLARGYPGLTIMTYQKGFFVPNLHQCSDTAERMDFDIAAAATDFAWEVTKDLASQDVGT